MGMELELKHLAPYLPYGLKALYNFENEENEIVSITGASLFSNEMHYQLIFKDGKTIGLFKDDFKPILRPLSDLTKEMKDGMTWVEYLLDKDPNYFNHKTYKYEFNCYWEFDLLVKNHFDVFGLIEKGLAIDKNTL